MNKITKESGYKETELGPLPIGWQSWTLEKIGKFQYGYTASAIEKNVGPKFLRISDISAGFSHIDWHSVPYCQIDKEKFSKYALENKDILIARIGATTGKTCFIENPPKSVFASYLIRLKICNKQVYPKFLYYFTHSVNYWKQINSNKESKLKKGVSVSQLKQFIIILPPLEEQKKIAGVLSAVQDAIEKTEAVIQAAKELKKSMMKHLFTYGPVPLSEKENVPLKETEIGLIPEEWGFIKLNKTCFLRKDKINPKYAKRFIYVGLEHIVPGTLEINDYGDPSQVRSTKNVFDNNNILYGKLRPYLDKAVIANRKGICSTDILVFEVNHRVVIPRYLGYFIHTKHFVNFAVRTMTGVNHPRTSWKKLSDFRIPVPTLTIQKNIVDILYSIDKKIQAEENKKKALEDLFNSLLHNLMTAKIRVNNLDLESVEI